MKKRNKIIYWIATIWLALGMLSTGIVQLLKERSGTGGINTINHLGYPEYILTILGIAKILGVITLFVPKFPLLKEWTYAGFFFLMCGAIFSHLAAGDGMAEIFPAVLLLVLTITSRYFKPGERKLTQPAHSVPNFVSSFQQA